MKNCIIPQTKNPRVYSERNGQPCVPSLSHRERLTIPRDQGVLYRGRDSTTSNEINFGDSDILKFSNGHLESIDIKTQETAEVLFECIRNCVQINDLTDVSLEPMALPILVNGRGAGTFEMFFATYQETGQFICISFAPEDSARFQDYVMELQKGMA